VTTAIKPVIFFISGGGQESESFPVTSIASSLPPRVQVFDTKDHSIYISWKKIKHPLRLAIQPHPLTPPPSEKIKIHK
jgi:hypothetical protein